MKRFSVTSSPTYSVGSLENTNSSISVCRTQCNSGLKNQTSVSGKITFFTVIKTTIQSRLWLRIKSISVNQTIFFSCLENVVRAKPDMTCMFSALQWSQQKTQPETTCLFPHGSGLHAVLKQHPLLHEQMRNAPLRISPHLQLSLSLTHTCQRG